MYKTSLQLQIDEQYMYKAIRWEIALGCFDYFFPRNFNNDNKTFQLDFRRTTRDQGAILSYAK